MKTTNLLYLPPSLWCLVVLVPALMYFGHTRWPLFAAIVLQQQHQQHSNGSKAVSSFSLASDALSDTCRDLSKLLYVQTACHSLGKTHHNPPPQLELSSHWEWLHTFATTNDNNSPYIVSSVWRHDAELGRGYLVVAHGNRLWRWERGGGPIPIGLSLHLDHAGCRPDRDCFSRQQQQHVGGVTVDFQGSDATIAQGALVVAEWGEGRIVRLEEATSGARTPIVLTPATVRPHQLLMTPFGDLWFLDRTRHENVQAEQDHCDNNDECSTTAPRGNNPVLFKIPQAMTVPALESLRDSRLAHNHSWWKMQQPPQRPVIEPISIDNTTQLVSLDGVALTPSWTSLFVAATTTSSAVLYQVSLTEEDDDDEDDENTTQPQRQRHSSTMVLDLSNRHPQWTRAGPLVVTKTGHLLWAVNEVHLLLWDLNQQEPTSRMTLLGHWTLPDTITSLTLGESFVYTTTRHDIYRLPTRGLGQPVAVPVNLAPRQVRREGS